VEGEAVEVEEGRLETVPSTRRGARKANTTATTEQLGRMERNYEWECSDVRLAMPIFSPPGLGQLERGAVTKVTNDEQRASLSGGLGLGQQQQLSRCAPGAGDVTPPEAEWCQGHPRRSRDRADGRVLRSGSLRDGTRAFGEKRWFAMTKAGKGGRGTGIERRHVR
jgi:hypothetical protein